MITKLLHHSHPNRVSPEVAAKAAVMEDNIKRAEEIITKWDVDGSGLARVTSLFFENHDEARRFLAAVYDLKTAMAFFVDHSSSPVLHAHLVHAHRLVEVAMKRLEKEFYQILLSNRDFLDGESLSRSLATSTTISRTSTANSLSDLDDTCGTDDDDLRAVDFSIDGGRPLPVGVMGDLRSIAECMISNGYAKECFNMYKSTRRPIVRDGLNRIGIDKQMFQHLHKLDWESVDHRIKKWIAAAPVAIRTVFLGERILSDFVFSSSSASVKESCFAEIIRDVAVEFFAFPANLATRERKSSEKIFRLLDLHTCLSELWPEIEILFSYNSTSSVQMQALSSVQELSDSVRYMLSDFETAIQKDSSKAVVPGGGLHPLTRYVMNYLVFLADYDLSLADIYADHPLRPHAPLPESFFHFSSTISAPPSPLLSPSSSPEEMGDIDDFPIAVSAHVSTRLAWILLVLLCKLDRKAELYKNNAALSYLFLSNNLHYVVQKVRRSKLRHLIGLDWIAQNEQKARAYGKNYTRMGWKAVVEAIPKNTINLLVVEGIEGAKRHMVEFNEAFEDACRKQNGWIVADGRMREEIKMSITRSVVDPYRAFYELLRVALREKSEFAAEVQFSPENVGKSIFGLFSGSPELDSQRSKPESDIENRRF